MEEYKREEYIIQGDIKEGGIWRQQCIFGAIKLEE